jgi:hypothetical protein
MSTLLSNLKNVSRLKVLRSETKENYDIVVVGGGIGGLYSAYSILEKYSSKKQKNGISLLVLEKEENLGGRVHTFEDEYMRVEAGAGRFHSSHHLLLELIEKLGLKDKIQPIISNPSFIDSSTGYRYPESICHSLIKRTILQSKNIPANVLREHSFINIAEKVLLPNEIEYMTNSFGFSTEFYYMNAYDAIILMKTLIGYQGDELNRLTSNSGDFLYLSGGLSQVIEKLRKKIIDLGGHIRTGVLVKQILCSPEIAKENGRQFNGLTETEENKKYMIEYKTESNGKKVKIYTDYCIFALPKQNLLNLHFFREHHYFSHILKNIYCGSLCRIYTKFSDGTWFKDLSRFTTQNDLRMVIPMDSKKGTMMISYSDNMYANKWNQLYKKKGMSELKKRLRELLSECLLMKVPPLGATRIFYWKCGVGYWYIGADSKEISKKLIKPFPDENIFVCGEHYSAKNQQWMEGALETSSQVVSHFP